jgi:voltage-gated potassium channel
VSRAGEKLRKRTVLPVDLQFQACYHLSGETFGRYTGGRPESAPAHTKGDDDMPVRKRIYDFIEPQLDAKSVYDYAMMAAIILSLVPLAFKQTNLAFEIIDKVTVSIFIVDYILRELTADYKLGKGGWSFVLYPFTFLAIIDLLAILPSFSILASGFRVLKLFRLLRTFRVFRAFKMFRYSRSMSMIIDVMRDEAAPLLVVATLALGYIVVSALVIFNVEPETFNTFFDALYWATISLTTMGYGDIYPVTTAGRVVTMISAFVGIAIVALPAGIITAGYMEEVQKRRKRGGEDKTEPK